MRHMARPPSFDKHTVLEAVERQFRKTGYAGTSLDDITAATGLGRGSLYAAFGDKHSLFVAALNDYCDRSEAQLRDCLAGPDDEALTRICAFLRSAVVRVFEDEDQLGCMAGRFAVELGGQDPSACDRISGSFNAMRDGLTECIEAAQRHGDLDCSANAADLAGLLITIVRGMDVVAQAGMSVTELDAVADRAIACLPIVNRRTRASAIS